MATKDRTSLKNEFKNGNLATGERFADLIDSVKVVQLPVVDPQVLGSTSSFIDSISQDADGKITATKKNVVLNYVNIQDKPQINGHTLNGDMSLKELGIINQIQLNDGTAIYPDQDGNVKLPVIPQTTNTITPGSAFVPTADAVDEALEEQNLLVPKANSYTAAQKYNASANINDRSAVVAQVTGEVQALGYKVLNPNASFASQVTAANTVYEIRDYFNLSETEQEPAVITIPANCKLRFEGGRLGGEYVTLQGNNTLIESDSTCIQKGITIAGTWGNDTIYTKWLELISVDDEYIEVEGVQQLNPNPTNNYLIFKQLECLINGTNGCKVEFEEGYYQCRFLDPYTSPEGTYEIDDVTYQMFSPFIQYPAKDKSYVYVDSLPYLDVNLNGSTLKSLQHIYPRWSFITLSNIKKCHIHNGTIKGFAAEFDYPNFCNHSRVASVDTYTVSNDYQVGVLLQLNSIDSIADNLILTNTTGDGMCVGSENMYTYRNGRQVSAVLCNSYKVSNCDISYCGRNGITLHSSNYSTLESLHIHHIGSDGGIGVIGSDGIMGQDPRCGIDIEYEDGLGLIPVMEWSNLYIHDCGEDAFGFAEISKSTTKSFRATNSVFDGTCQTITNPNVTPIFDNCKFIISKDWTGFKGKSIYQNCEFDLRATYLLAHNTFRNCRFIDNATSNWGSLPYLFIKDSGDTSDCFENCYFLIKHQSIFLDVTVYDSQFYFDKYSETYKTFFFYCGGTTFTRCNFEALHSTIQDGVSVLDTYNVAFNNINNHNGTAFYYCKFINITGTDSSTPQFTNPYGYIFDNCEGNLKIRTGTSVSPVVGNIIVNKCNGDMLRIYGQYAQPTTIFSIVDSKFTTVSTDYNMKAYQDNYVFDGCDIEVQTEFYFKNFTIKNSKVTFPYTNDAFGSYLSGIIVNNSDVTFKKSITTAAVNKITLNECTVRGAVSQRLYQGEANDCKFVNDANSGTSTQRPPYNLVVGQKYFDTTLGKPIFWNGTAWIDGNGETVGLQVSDTSVLIADSPKTVSVYYGGSTAPTITVLNSDDSTNTWLTAALGNNTLTLTASANNTSAPRGAKVLVTLGDEIVIINVIQTQTVSNV